MKIYFLFYPQNSNHEYINIYYFFTISCILSSLYNFFAAFYPFREFAKTVWWLWAFHINPFSDTKHDAPSYAHSYPRNLSTRLSKNFIIQCQNPSRFFSSYLLRPSPCAADLLCPNWKFRLFKFLFELPRAQGQIWTNKRVIHLFAKKRAEKCCDLEKLPLPWPWGSPDTSSVAYNIHVWEVVVCVCLWVEGDTERWWQILCFLLWGSVEWYLIVGPKLIANFQSVWSLAIDRI